MTYGKFPIRISLISENYDLLIEALKGNEKDYEGSHIADGAKALREKIERYGQLETGEDGGEVVRLGFYENEGREFIWQFLAAANNAAEYRELLEFSDSCGVD